VLGPQAIQAITVPIHDAAPADFVTRTVRLLRPDDNRWESLATGPQEVSICQGIGLVKNSMPWAQGRAARRRPPPWRIPRREGGNVGAPPTESRFHTNA